MYQEFNMNMQIHFFFSCLVLRRSTFAALVMVVTVISTASSFVKPTANAYVLNSFSLHLFYILAVEMRWCENAAVLGGAFVTVFDMIHL